MNYNNSHYECFGYYYYGWFMKKNSFIGGAFIVTIGIVITKIIGILYVIPFYNLIGDKGGALYGYAYNIYNVFLNISSAGIPMAISKIVSEYNALGLDEDKKRAFTIGKKIALFLSIISFVILFLFAPLISIMIIGDISGGNSQDEIALVIRIISTSILVVPLLSIYRGYFQGHKYMKPASISQIIEQLLRVIVIIIGSYMAVRIFNLSLSTTVGIAVFGATVGALFAYFYVITKYYHNKEIFENHENTKRKFSDKAILKQILIYAIPLVLIDIFRSLYNSVDAIMLVKVLVNGIGYSVVDAENIISIISTWGQKLNAIVSSIGTGVAISLVPFLSENYILNDKKMINNNVNKSLQVLLFLSLPMTIGLSLLAKPIWTIFYGYSDLGISTFSYSIFTVIFMCIFLIVVSIIQLLKQYRYVIVCLVVGLITKIAFNIPLIYLFNKLNVPAHYGSIMSTILGYLIPSIIGILYLKVKFNVTYKDTLNKLMHIIIGTILMSLMIIIFKLFIPIYTTTRFLNILIVIVYSLVGLLIYFGYMWKVGLLKKMINEIKNK